MSHYLFLFIGSSLISGALGYFLWMSIRTIRLKLQLVEIIQGLDRDAREFRYEAKPVYLVARAALVSSIDQANRFSLSFAFRDHHAEPGGPNDQQPLQTLTRLGDAETTAKVLPFINQFVGVMVDSAFDETATGWFLVYIVASIMDWRLVEFKDALIQSANPLGRLHTA